MCWQPWNKLKGINVNYPRSDLIFLLFSINHSYSICHPSKPEFSWLKLLMGSNKPLCLAHTKIIAPGEFSSFILSFPMIPKLPECIVPYGESLTKPMRLYPFIWKFSTVYVQMCVWVCVCLSCVLMWECTQKSLWSLSFSSLLFPVSQLSLKTM